MKRNLWFGMMIVMLAAVMCTTGCRKKGAKGLKADGTDIGNTTGTELAGGDMAPRPNSGEMNIITDVKFETVLFDYDSAQVGASERAKVEAVADYLKKNTDANAICEGHCDERGSREYNMALGERRSQAVRDYLTKLGIDGARIQTKSYGNEKPANMGHDEAAWRENRRVDFVLFKQ